MFSHLKFMAAEYQPRVGQPTSFRVAPHRHPSQTHGTCGTYSARTHAGGTALLAASFIWAPDVLRRTALVTLVLTGLAGAAAYYTGEPAVKAVRGLPGVVREVTRAHEGMAERAFYIGDVVALLALMVLVRWRRRPITTGVTAGMLLVSAFLMCGMAYTALTGGRVRHSEVRPGAQPADAARVEPPRPPPAP